MIFPERLSSEFLEGEIRIGYMKSNDIVIRHSAINGKAHLTVYEDMNGVDNS
jgi:hypothetical protein